jgi:very-long-chain (3R)-3-hydroxyacyl-CoA dehydratase
MMKRNWLIGFNAVTLLAWLVFIAVAMADGGQLTARGSIVLLVAQGLAVFEILNAVLGIAGANWLLTTLQVSSRLLVMGILVLMGRTCPCSGFESWGYPLITAAWSITEVVRALHYLAGLFNKEWKVVNWLRYSLFTVLYPLGVTGEFLIMYGFWKWRGGTFDLTTAILAIIALSYLIFFPKLFGHMLAQRKKKLG